MADRPKILFLSGRDVTRPHAWSHYSMARALQQYVGEVIPFQHPKPIKKYSLPWWRRRFFGKPPVPTTGKVEQCKETAQKLAEQLKEIDFDVLFAPMGAGSVAYLDIEQPIIYLSDATYALMKGYYNPDKVYTEAEIAEGNEIERSALHNATHVIASNDWAARSMLEDYDIPPKKVHVIYSGPNLEETPPREVLKKPDIKEGVKLLFVGRNDWRRKGGDIALETVEALHEKGVKAHLTMCGVTPPGTYNRDLVTVIPYIDKSKPAEYQQLMDLYNESHFLLFPSRAECHGLTTNEANAYGTPVLANRTGGIPDYIKDGVNGFLFEPEQRGDAYAAKLIELKNNTKKYYSLMCSARHLCEGRYNWHVWAKTINELIL